MVSSSALGPPLRFGVALLLLALLPGCQGTRLPATGASAGSPDGAATEPAVRAQNQLLARVSPLGYADDDRFGELARTWDARVAAAVDLLERRAGLSLEGPSARAVLAPLGDERQGFTIRTEMSEGRRQPVVTIGAEGLVSGVRDADRTIARALAEAVFEVTALTHGPVPAWVPALAGVLTAADEREELAEVHRRVVMGDPHAATVDAELRDAARATGLAVRLLLEDRGQLAEARRLLTFAADGDDPTWMLTRLLNEPDASWVGPARDALVSRLRALDPTPWQVLRQAEETLRNAGRGGLEAGLPDPVPEPIRGEVKWLRARAAALEGDWPSVRGTLDTITFDELVSLRSPADALALYVDVESRPDGDPDRMRYWVYRLDMDFPKSAARQELFDRRPTLGLENDPVRWLDRVRRQLRATGTDALELETLERIIRVLLADHRSGEAARFVEALGERADAPELVRVVAAVADAEAEPSAAARAINSDRVEAWFTLPGPDTRRAVVEGGQAAWDALLARLPPPGGARRQDVLRLLVSSGGVVKAARAFAERWSENPGTVMEDLDALAAGGRVFDVRDAIQALTPDRLSAALAAAAWQRVSFVIDDVWLDANPTILMDLRNPAYPVRRAAFDRVVDAGQASPELVGFALEDPAALQRQRAAQEAGALGCRALAQEALLDPAPLVRSAAALALAQSAGRDAVEPLLARLAADPAPEVRISAAEALLRVDSTNPVVLDQLILTQADPASVVRDVVGTRLQAVDPAPLARALARALRAEVARRELRRSVVTRIVVIFQRVANMDLGYAPDTARPRLSAMAGDMEAYADVASQLVVVDESGRRGR